MGQVATKKTKTVKNGIPVDDATTTAMLAEANHADEIWLVIGIEGIVCRYGPYTPKQAGELISKIDAEDIFNVTIVANMGMLFNLGLARRISDHIKRQPENTK